MPHDDSADATRPDAVRPGVPGSIHAHPDQPLPQWLSALAAPRPDPGGGAAAAVLLAAAAALAEMVAGYSTHERFPAGGAAAWAVAATVLADAPGWRSHALELAALDAAASARFAAAFRLPAETGDERAARSEAIARGSADAALASAAVGDAAEALVPHLEALDTAANPALVADVAVSAAILGAALRAVVINVEGNLAALEGVPEGAVTVGAPGATALRVAVVRWRELIGRLDLLAAA